VPDEPIRLPGKSPKPSERGWGAKTGKKPGQGYSEPKKTANQPRMVVQFREQSPGGTRRDSNKKKREKEKREKRGRSRGEVEKFH